MKAVIVNCTLKASPERSNTGALAAVLGDALRGQAWTYWNRGPGPGPDYLDSEAGHEWSHSTGRAAASNLLAAARALSERPIPAPPGS